MSKAKGTEAELVKDPEQIEVGPERFDAFHGEEKRDLLLLACLLDFRARSANREPLGGVDLKIKPRNLVQYDSQPHLREIAILEIQGDSRHRDIARRQVVD